MVLLALPVPLLFLYLLIIASADKNSTSPVVTSSSTNSTSTTVGTCEAVKWCLRRIDHGKVCDVLPVPERARPSPFRRPFSVSPLREGVWVYRDASYMSLIIYENRRRTLMLIDQPDSNAGSNKPEGSRTHLTDATLQVLNGSRPLRIHLVYSHPHLDHIGASRLFLQWARRTFRKVPISIFGTTKVRNLVRRSVSRRAVWPTRIVRFRRIFRLSQSLTVQLSVINAHSGKDLLVYIPRSSNGTHDGVVMLVDVVFPRWAPWPYLGGTEDVAEYIKTHERLLKMDFKYFVAGHPEMADKADVAESLEFVLDVQAAARRAVTEVNQEDLESVGYQNFFTPGTAEFQNKWFFALKARLALHWKKCAREMIAKWGCRVGGVAQTAESHCYTMDRYIGIMN